MTINFALTLLFDLDVTVMVALPAFIPFPTPLYVTVAIFLLLVLYVAFFDFKPVTLAIATVVYSPA